MIEKVTRALDTYLFTHAFCSCYTVISAVSQTYIVQLLYHVSDLLTSICKHVNDLSTTPHCTQIVSFAIIKLFSLFNTRAKTNDIDSTRPVPLSMNELTAEY